MKKLLVSAVLVTLLLVGSGGMAGGAGGNIGINLANVGFPWMRCRYVASTGTGTLDVFATVKNFS